jgi:hypothetical protein
VITAEETRERLRIGAAAVRKSAEMRRSPWQPPVLADFAMAVRVLAFDASLANVGWAVLFAEPGGITVECHGTIKPKQDDDGYMGTWQRARDLRRALYDLGLDGYIRNPQILKAVEAPVVGAGHRKESSLIAGMTVWMESDPCEVISATHVSAVLLGDPRIKSAERKPAIRAAVCRYVPEAAAVRGWNEHERDAVSVGLTRLFDLKEKGGGES